MFLDIIVGFYHWNKILFQQWITRGDTLHLYSILWFSKMFHMSSLTKSSEQYCEVDVTTAIWEKKELSHRAFSSAHDYPEM